MTYPITIVLDRYGGTYSGGKWIAWPLYVEDIPPEPSADDATAMAFWINERRCACGRGATPNEALTSLTATPLRPTECAVDWESA